MTNPSADAAAHRDRRMLTREQIRSVDRVAIKHLGIPGAVLMENAALGCVQRWFSSADRDGVVILCGSGNNAGDGFVIARQLAIRGIACRCVMVGDPSRLPPDARLNFDIAHRLANLEWLTSDQLPTSDDPTAMAEALFAPIGKQPVFSVVDALLGTGSQGPPRGRMATVVAAANLARVKRLAIDLPSGLDCDTGDIHEPTFRADETVTFVAHKPAMATTSGRSVCGVVTVAHIGVHLSDVDRVMAELDLPGNQVD